MDDNKMTGGAVTQAILNERHKTHGNYEQQAATSQALKDIIRRALEQNKKTLPADMQESLEMLCVKVSRIIHGDQYHVDSWRDAAGYMQLPADRLDGVSR